MTKKQLPFKDTLFTFTQLRLTNFTQPGAFMSQTTESLCVEGFHSLSADFSSNSVNIMLTTSSGSVSSMTIQINELSEEPVRLYLGGLTGMTITDLPKLVITFKKFIQQMTFKMSVSLNSYSVVHLYQEVLFLTLWVA